LGADLGIDYKTTPRFSEQIIEFTKGKGADIIFDPIMSGPQFNEVSLLKTQQLLELEYFGTRF